MVGNTIRDVIGRAIIRVCLQKERAIVLEINPVTEVTIPGGIIIVSIAGEVGADHGVDDNRSGGGFAYDRGGSGNNHRSRSYNGEAYTRAAEADMGADVDLGIAFCTNEGSGYDGDERKYLFHICIFKLADVSSLILHPHYFGYERGSGI